MPARNQNTDGSWSDDVGIQANGNLITSTNPLTVGGSALNIRITPTVTASAYSSGYVVGGVQTIANAANTTPLSSMLVGLFIKSINAITPALTLYFFDTNPANGTYTDHASLTWNATDFGYLIHQHTVSAADFITVGSKATAGYGVSATGKLLKLTSTTLYMLPVATASFTPVSTTDFTFGINLLKD